MLLHVLMQHPLILSLNPTQMVFSPMCEPYVVNHHPA